MLYYNGKNLSPYFVVLLLLIVGIVYYRSALSQSQERIIGYEIDEMRTPDGLPFYDTVRVIMRKNSLIFLKDYGTYKFLTKESSMAVHFEKPAKKAPSILDPLPKSTTGQFRRDVINRVPANPVNRVSTKEKPHEGN